MLRTPQKTQRCSFVNTRSKDNADAMIVYPHPVTRKALEATLLAVLDPDEFLALNPCTAFAS